jgi:hypothetical protein
MVRRSVVGFLLLIALHVFGASSKKQIKLQIVNQTTHLVDETTMYLDFGISADFNPQEDSRKIFTSDPLLPQIFSRSADGVPCNINGYPALNSATTIPLDVKGDSVGGPYIISATMLDNFDPTSIIRLRDNHRNIFFDLRQGDYNFQLAPSDTVFGRFAIEVLPPVQITTNDAGCRNNDGSIGIFQEPAFRWTYCQLYDSNNALKNSFAEVTAGFTFGDLEQGAYRVAFIYNNYVAIKPVYVSGHQINASFNVSFASASIGQTLEFISSAPNAEEYVWDFGDSSAITGVANPQTSYYQSGTFTVLLKCSNSYGCTDSATMLITVGSPDGVIPVTGKDVTVIVEGDKILLSRNRNGGAPLNCSVFDLSGKVITNMILGDAPGTLDLGWPANGVYILNIDDGDSSFSRKLSVQH